MLVTDRNNYITTIYSAIVVNDDKSQDPNQKNRVQIYIPSMHFSCADFYEEYMKNDNKQDSPYFKEFPWATLLIENVKVGDIVYGTFIENSSNSYLILGLENGTSGANAIGGNIQTDSVINYAMNIILHNEIGVGIGAWSDNKIDQSYYSKIVLHDGGLQNKNGQWIKQGAWAIGLIQWNGVRAYDTVCEIAKNDGNWREYFTADSSLRVSIENSLKRGGTSGERSKFGEGYNPEKNGTTYNAIVRLISSKIGQDTQNKVAYNAIADIINMLVDKGCYNPAILIYLADFYNQYGSAQSSTTRKAVEACSKGGTMMSQLDWLISNQLKPNFSSFNTYTNRRNTTYTYINELYNNGKLTEDLLTGEQTSSVSISGTGQYCIPFIGKFMITATWGHGGYPSGRYHTGIDFGCPIGTKIIASSNGTIRVYSNYEGKTGYGKALEIKTDDNHTILYRSFEYVFSYIWKSTKRTSNCSIWKYREFNRTSFAF